MSRYDHDEIEEEFQSPEARRIILRKRNAFPPTPVSKSRHTDTVQLPDGTIEKAAKHAFNIVAKGHGVSIEVNKKGTGLDLKPKHACFICTEWIEIAVHYSESVIP